MADPTLIPTHFDGTDINDATYGSSWLAAHDVASTPEFDPIEVETPGDYSYPTTPRAQPQSRVFPLYVHVKARTQAALYAFKKLFDPFKGDVLLLADDGDGTTWRMTVRVVGIPQFAHLPDHWVVRLHASRPIWESDTLHSEAQTCDDDPETWAETVAGTQRTYPILEVKPTVAAGHANKYLHRQYINIAWRSELPGTSTNGLPYPTEVNEGAIDLSALHGADPSELLANGDDFRLYVDGVEQDRQIDKTLAADWVWPSITWSPMRTFTVTDAWTIGPNSPANGEWFDVSDPEGTLGWDDDGYFMLEDETCHYVEREAGRLKLSSVNGRGARNSTAAGHDAATVAWWEEHEIYALYDNQAAANPPAADDRQPVFDLPTSSNLIHKYPSLWTAPGTLRPGQFLRRYTNDNLLSAAISYLEDGSDARFRDVVPTAKALRYNNLELYAPCGIKAAAGAIKHDVAMEDLLCLEVYGIDLEGLETLLERYDSGNDGAAVTLTPAAVLSRLRYCANLQIITGADPNDMDDIEVLASARSQQFTLDEASEIWHILTRLKKTDAPDGDIELYLATDDGSDAPETQLTPIFTITANDLTTSYADYVKHYSEAGGPDFTWLAAGIYWLRLQRSLSGGGIVLWALSPGLIYPKGIFHYSEGGPAGPNSGATFADDAAVGDIAWTNPGNAATSDDVRATASLLEDQSSHYIKATNFNMGIPADAAIDGIKVEWETMTDANSSRDKSVRLVKGGVISGEDKANSSMFTWHTTEKYVSYGGPTDLWGLSWTAANINAADFGAVTSADNATAQTVEFRIDHVRITVYYTTGDYSYRKTVRFAIIGRPQSNIQPEAPSGSGHEAVLDDIEITFDNATPRTLKIVVSAQEEIYHLAGVIKNDDTGQEISLNFVLPINSPTLTIDCEAHTVVRSDTGESVLGAISLSDLEEWMRFDPGEDVHLRYTEAGIGTVIWTLKWRERWA